MGRFVLIVLAVILIVAFLRSIGGQDSTSLEGVDKRLEDLELANRGANRDLQALKTRISHLEQGPVAVASAETETPTATVRPTESATERLPESATERPTESATEQPTATARPTATTRPTWTPAPTVAVPDRVSVTQIFEDYRERPTEAAKMYEGTTFEVSGEVTNGRGDRIQLHVPGLFTDFICWIVPDQKNLDGVLSRSQEVVMQGVGGGKSGNTFTMRSCTFVSPSPTELRSISATRVAGKATSESAKATSRAAQEETRVAERATRDAERATREAGVAKERAIRVAVTATAKAKQDASSADATATATHKGFHCLSLWDGHSWEMNDLIKTHLNDPDSFEARETRIAPQVDGTHMIIVEFTAENALGGTVRNIATGMIDHDTCEALIVLAIEPK